MAGSFVAAASVQGAGTMTCANPTGTVLGDVMTAFVSTDYGTYAAMTAPTGWTLRGGYDAGSNAIHVKVFTKTAGASEATSYAFPQGTSSDGTVNIVTARGCTETGLIISVVFDTSTSTSRAAPSLTGAVAGAVLLCGAMLLNAGASPPTRTFTPPSGMTECADIQAGNYTASTVAYLLGPSSPTGTKTFTCSGVANVDVGGIQSSIVLQQSATATPPGDFLLLF